MKAFLLHDGENGKRTDELHAFMAEWVKQEGSDWDGSDTGVSLWCSAIPGDAFVIGRDGGVRVLRQSEPVRIDKWTFPFVYLAFRTIELDNGAHHVNRITGANTVELDFFMMPFAYGVEKLAEADAALEKIAGRSHSDRERFETFVCGAEHEQFEMMKGRPDLEEAHSLLNDWFNKENGWTDLSDNYGGDDAVQQS